MTAADTKAVQLESRRDYKNSHYSRLAQITTSPNYSSALRCTRSSGLVMLYCRKHGQLGQHPLPELSRVNLARHVFLAEPDPAQSTRRMDFDSRHCFKHAWRFEGFGEETGERERDGRPGC